MFIFTLRCSASKGLNEGLKGLMKAVYFFPSSGIGTGRVNLKYEQCD